MFSAIWLWLGARNPSIPAKMAFGLIFLGVGFCGAGVGVDVCDARESR